MADIEAVQPQPQQEEEVQATEDIFIDSSEVGDEKPQVETTTETPAPETQEPEWLDPAFKAGGKSTEEATKEQAKAYKEAVRKWQTSAHEAAEHRKLIDSYILNSINKDPSLTPAEKVELRKTVFEEELGLDGQKVRDGVFQMVAPALKPLYDEVVRLRGIVAGGTIEKAVTKANPDHFSIVNSQEFGKWAVENYPPKVLYMADTDPELAVEIVNKYKTTKKEPPPVAPVATKPQFSETPKAPVGEKTWSRAELIRMQQQEPEKYQSMQKDILRAYAEGRIK